MTSSTGQQNVRFPSGDGEAFGYLRVPESGSGPGVVVVQEWWGLTTHVAGIVDRLAAAGSSRWHRTCTASSTVGTIGFCMGGGFVFALAALRPDLVSAAVPFYGLPRDASTVPRIRAAVQGHYGLEDRGIPVERVESVFSALAERPDPAAAELHLYRAGHAFLNDENLIGTYDPQCAALAWSRAVAFLTEHVR